MHRRTIAALNRINQHFYRSHAAAFSSTRKGAWRGWARLLELVSSHRHRLLPVRILDLGCGNGRFGRLAGTTLSPPHSYIGLDQSLPLLSEAARRAPGDFLAVDLSLPDSSIPLSSASVDLAVALGFLHHIPSFSRRRELIDEVTRCLVPGGLLALSHWQFGAEARFQRRALPWSKADTLLSGPIDPKDLEKGDFLLPWGEESSTSLPARYCHHVDPAEAERLIVGLPYSVLEVFSGDGRENRLNLYYLLRRHD